MSNLTMESLVLLLLLMASFPLFSFSDSPTSPSPLFPKEALPTKSGYLPIANTSSSNSSYLPISRTSPSALFYAFYEAQHPISPPSLTPLLVWLQGGPGCSSMIGNFFELGPWLVTDKITLEPNPASWNRRFGLLFIDSPIGTGFSFVSSTETVPRDQTTIAKHLHAALQHFLSLGSSFRSRPLYITGESYGGKYVPSAAYYILQQNKMLHENEQINLQGIAIGNGLSHPVAQIKTHAASAYFFGLINDKQRADIEALQNEAVKRILENQWPAATSAMNKVLDTLQNVTGLATLGDIRKNKDYAIEKLVPFLQKREAREALGASIGVFWNSCSAMIHDVLYNDITKSVKFMVEEILRTERLKVLLYQGIYDVQDGVVSNEAWMKELEWVGLQRFLTATRNVWKVRGEMAGYVQKWGKLSHVAVSGAGHMVPADQGVNSQTMIEDWVQDNGLFHVTD